MFKSQTTNIIFALALFLSFAPLARAQEWSLTTSDFQTRPIELKSLSSSDLRVQFPGIGEPTTIPLDQFVSIQHSTAAASTNAKFTLLLRDGDRLIGEPAKTTGEDLTWKSSSIGDINVPLDHMVMMARGNVISPPSTLPTQDVITLSNGDTLAGVVNDFSPTSITIQSDNGPITVARNTITNVIFAATTAPHRSIARAFRIRLIDGTTITTTGATLADDQLIFALNSKSASPLRLPLSQLDSIEQINGPISWLSARTPTENIQTPYFGGAPTWPARMDTAVDGSPLQYNNQHFTHGIGVHAYSKLTYTLEPGWTYFQTQYAIDSQPDHPRPLADVTIQIQLDGKTVQEKTHLRAGTLSPPQKISLGNAKTLTLIVTYGNAGDTQDQLNWIEPALIR